MTKTIEISYEELEAALVPYLISAGKIQDKEEAEYILDIDVPLNENGLVEIDIEEVDWDSPDFSNPTSHITVM